jgi:hypothetical protein
LWSIAAKSAASVTGEMKNAMAIGIAISGDGARIAAAPKSNAPPAVIATTS